MNFRFHPVRCGCAYASKGYGGTERYGQKQSGNDAFGTQAAHGTQKWHFESSASSAVAWQHSAA